MPRRHSLLLICLCFCLLAACGGRQQPSRAVCPPAPWMGTLEDQRRFPQDLAVYARKNSPDKPLLSPAEQSVQSARFQSIFFGPWDMTRGSVRKRDVAAIFKKARGYRHGNVRWTQEEWDGLARNADLANFPSGSQPAITLRNTNLREMPTAEARFSEPTPDPRANPFDYIQYSLLPVGTPVRIVHTSLDSRWHYVECPVAGGWVSAGDLAAVSPEFVRSYRSAPLAALLRDKVGLPLSSGTVTANIGTLLPLHAAAPTGQGHMHVQVPVRGADGMAATLSVQLAAADAARWPVPMTAANAARVGNVMMHQPYGWGGMFGERDCSALTREFFTPFGIWLPRNSAAQARIGTIVPLEGMSTEEKENLIVRNGIPFLSLVGMRGHIMLYVGTHKGRPAVFHNFWGVRTTEGGNDNARFVIGRTAVTSITPGRELKNLYQDTTLADRLRTLSTPAENR